LKDSGQKKLRISFARFRPKEAAHQLCKIQANNFLTIPIIHTIRIIPIIHGIHTIHTIHIIRGFPIFPDFPDFRTFLIIRRCIAKFDLIILSKGTKKPNLFRLGNNATQVVLIKIF